LIAEFAQTGPRTLPVSTARAAKIYHIKAIEALAKSPAMGDKSTC